MYYTYIYIYSNFQKVSNFTKIFTRHHQKSLYSLTLHTDSYHFRSKSETTTDLFLFAKVSHFFETTKFIWLKIVKIHLI